MLSEPQEARYDTYGNLIQAYVHIHKPVIVFQGVVSAYGEREGAYVALSIGSTLQGSLAAVQPEMTLYIGFDSEPRNGGSQRVRAVDVGDSTLLIGRAVSGQEMGQIAPITSAIVTVYDDYRPFMKAPHMVLNGETVTVYKDEQLYPSDNEAQPPVAHAGTDRLIITSNTSASITLSSLSYPVRAGATLTGVVWDVRDGTITTGTSTSETIIASFPRGDRWIGLTVTDSNGITHKTHRLIAVQAPNDCIPAEISALSVTPYEVSMSLEIDSRYLTFSIPPRAKTLVAEVENYGATLLSYAERFSGWLTVEDLDLEDQTKGIHTSTLSVEDSAAFLRRNNLFSQSLNGVDSEELGGWFRMKDANIDRMMHHILYWHTNILSCCGFTWSGEGDTYPFTALTTQGGTVWQSIEKLAKAFGHEFTVDMRSGLSVVGDPYVLPTAAQASDYGLPTQRTEDIDFNFTPKRYQTYQLSAVKPPQNFWFKALGIIATSDPADATVVGCIAPSNAPNFGTSELSRTDYLCVSQEELNIWAANYAAVEMSGIGELKLVATNPTTILDISRRRYVTVELPSFVTERYNVEGRWVIERIDYTYDAGIKTASYVFRKEVVALQPARTLDQITDDTLDQSWDSFDTSINPTTGVITQGYANMALTQDELEESLGKLRLKAYISDLATDSDGNTDDDDPDNPDDEEDAETIYERNAKRNGGYWEIAKGLANFFVDLQDFYDDVDTLPNVKTLMIQYITTSISGADPAAVSDWVDYIVDTPDATLPTLDLAAREVLTGLMYCEESASRGLNEYIIDVISTTYWDRWFFAAAAMSAVQYEIWYNYGATYPFGAFTGYACYTYPPETLKLNTTQIHNQTPVYGMGKNWANIENGGTRLVQIKITGKYEDTDDVKDGLYVLDKSTDVLTQSNLTLSASYLNNTSLELFTNFAPVGGYPAYAPSGTYNFTATWTDPFGISTLGSSRYRIMDTRSPSGTGLGSFEVTITDLGIY